MRQPGPLARLLDAVLAAFLRARAGGALPTLDLHGLGVREALDSTRRFLAEARAAGVPTVRIVCGKGRHSPAGKSVLGPAIAGWLAEGGTEHVREWGPDVEARGEHGAFIVHLRPPQAPHPPRSA